MAYVYTDWEHGTADGTPFVLDWSSDAAVAGWSLNPHAEAVRQAVVERCPVTGDSVPSALSSEVPDDWQPTAAYKTAVQSIITALIGGFVDHTDNGGAWTGLADCAPLWDEAGILAELGDWSRLSELSDGRPRAAWIRQCKRILSLLLWTRGSGNLANLEIADVSNVDGYGDSSSWPLAIARSQAQWLLTGWGGESPSGFKGGFTGARWKWSPGSGWSAIPIIERGRFWSEIYSIDTTLQHSAQAYIFTESPTSGTDVSEWDEEGLGYTDDAWNLIETLSEAATASRRTTGYLGDITALTPLPSTYPAQPAVKPSAGGVSDYHAAGWEASDSRWVLKWNVPGGFTFQ